jgi:hypothetical protein
VPPDASDKHFDFVLRNNYTATKIKLQADNNIAADANTFAKIHIASTKEAAAVRTAMMRSATVLALPFLATGLTV